MNAREWLGRDEPQFPDISLLGAPLSRTSVPASEAWSTPAAFRATLGQFPTWEAVHESDLSEMAIRDCGDVADDRQDTDVTAGRTRVMEAVTTAAARGGAVFVIGGDNSVTVPTLLALMQAHPEERWGLVTLDAHHECDALDNGPTNGTVVRELVEAGLPGNRVAQIGIHPLGNDIDEVRFIRRQGVHVFPVREVRLNGVHQVAYEAHLALNEAGVTSVFVDFSMDCADRSYAPACPMSLPGGLNAGDLIHLARLLGRDFRVAGADITEVDANADVAGMTIRMAAEVFLSFCAGFACRETNPRRR